MQAIEELKKAFEPHIYFLSDHHDSLLDYINIIANKYRPLMMMDMESGIDKPAQGYFLTRYFNGNIDKSALQKYLGDRNLQDTIKAFGYDIEKFWYLILFIQDFSYGQCFKGYELEETPRTKIEKIIKRILDNADSLNIDKIDGEPSTNIKKAMKITLEVKGERKLVIDEPNEILFHGLALFHGLENDNLTKLLKKNKHPFRVSNGVMDYSFLPNSIQIYFFAKMFLSFFELKQPKQTRKQKNSSISFNRKALIADLIPLIGLSRNEEFDEESLKGILRQYKNLSFDRILNGIYL